MNAHIFTLWNLQKKVNNCNDFRCVDLKHGLQFTITWTYYFYISIFSFLISDCSFTNAGTVQIKCASSKLELVYQLLRQLHFHTWDTHVIPSIYQPPHDYIQRIMSSPSIHQVDFLWYTVIGILNIEDFKSIESPWE